MGVAKAAAKTIIDSLVHTDTVGLVWFNTKAQSENNYLVQATNSYRSSMGARVDSLEVSLPHVQRASLTDYVLTSGSRREEVMSRCGACCGGCPHHACSESLNA